jgi:hypothetical protein
MALVFLDVDGTLLPFGATAAAAGSDSLVPRIDPRHGPRLARLPGELVWATTWMEQANEAIAPILGLPPLPVLYPLAPTVEDDYFGLHWKTRAIVDRAAGHPFAWIDDEITASDQEWIDDRHAAPALLLRVDAHHGLTTQDLDALEAWLLGPGSGASPHAVGEVVAGVQVDDESGPSGFPPEQPLGRRARHRAVDAEEARHPADVVAGAVDRDGDHR